MLRIPWINVKQKDLWIWIVLFVIGAFGWCVFLRDLNNFHFHDWAKEHVYLNVIRQSVLDGIVPWKWSEAYYHGSLNFLANPEVCWTPDILLLRFVSNGTFFLIHLCLFYAIGLVGLFKLTRRLRMNTGSTVLFWMLFSFNGYGVAHIVEGHVQWFGYFLLPWTLICFIRESEQTDHLHLCLVNFLLFLNGSFHIAIWNFLLVIALSGGVKKDWRTAMKYGVLTIGLGLFRLLPAALWFRREVAFVPGYASLNTLIDALTMTSGFDRTVVFGAGAFGWWEYSVFVGFLGLILLCLGLQRVVKIEYHEWTRATLMVMLVAAIASMGHVYAVFQKSHIPILATERAPSRFIIYPVLAMICSGCVVVGERLAQRKLTGVFVLFLILICSGTELVRNMYEWNPSKMATSANFDVPSIEVVTQADAVYKLPFLAGAVTSLLAMVYALRSRKLALIQRNPGANGDVTS